MATHDATASIIPLHRPKTPAERAAAYRARKRQKTETCGNLRKPVSVTPGVTPTLTPKAVTPVTPSRLAPALLISAAFALAGVGVTMNGWFARSLGSSEIAGWCFLAIGVAADLVALAVPACAARLWQARQRGAALAGWSIWFATFIFAVIAGIGFASVNISDTSLARASRSTPATEAAKVALTDAMATRDRECVSGTGKNCRAREDAVAERRRLFDAATSAVEQSADPQTLAASKMVAWLTAGNLRPTGDDFAMLRLILLAMLPQIGGILLMIARATD